MTEPSHPYTVLDVFTDRPLSGNPLAVFTAGEEVPSRLMQATARELNLSETVFLLPGDDEADATIRIFTPGAELRFAGHPTLGAAFVVGGEGGAAEGQPVVRLRTGNGVVPVALTRELGEVTYGEMAQPKPTVATFPAATALLAALGVPPLEAPAGPRLPIEVYDNGALQVMVALSSPDQVAALAPDMAAIHRLGVDQFPAALCVSCFAEISDGHYKTRMFAPGVGVPEDPATGAAAGPLALHLARHGWTTAGDRGQEIEIVQGVEIGRPSVLRARIDGDPTAPTTIAVGGSAVIVAHGNFRLA
jgi:trans-2,3-dihydro-3-hydroxyanthranilate isomerase